MCWLVQRSPEEMALLLHRIPLPVRGSGEGYVDWLYLDDDLRITRGSAGSLFVHVRA